MEALVKPLQPLKALSPIEVTELGMVVFLQPASKVLVAVSIIALQLSLESYLELPLSTTIDSKPLQPEKALPRIEVTELGMVTLVKPLQSSKALSPIEVTELGMVTLVKPLQPLKAPLPIEVTEHLHYVVLLFTNQ